MRRIILPFLSLFMSLTAFANAPAISYKDLESIIGERLNATVQVLKVGHSLAPVDWLFDTYDNTITRKITFEVNGYQKVTCTMTSNELTGIFHLDRCNPKLNVDDRAYYPIGYWESVK